MVISWLLDLESQVAYLDVNVICQHAFVLLDLLICNDTMVNDSPTMMATAIREDDVSNSLQMADLSQVIAKKFFTLHGGPSGLSEEDIRKRMIQCAETFVKTNGFKSIALAYYWGYDEEQV